MTRPRTRPRDKAWAELSAAFTEASEHDRRPYGLTYAQSFVLGYLYESIPPSAVRGAAAALRKRTAESIRDATERTTP